MAPQRDGGNAATRLQRSQTTFNAQMGKQQRNTGVLFKTLQRRDGVSRLQVVHNSRHVSLLVVPQTQVLAVAEARAREIEGKHAYVFGQKHWDDGQGIETAAGVAVTITEEEEVGLNR